MVKRALPFAVVAAALIFDESGRLLICRRAAGGSCANLYEFPGGKQEAGEALELCLRRECAEELGVVPEIVREVWQTSQRYSDIEVELHFFLCLLPSTSHLCPFVHRELRWVERAELDAYAFCPGDAELIVRLRAGDFLPPEFF